jgi:hypothetical protein
MFFYEALRPEARLLPEYSRQIPETRAWVFRILGLLSVIALGGLYGRSFATFPPNLLLVLLAPLALMALLVIWVLPDRDTAPSLAMSKFLLAFFAVSVAWPDYLALQLPGLPWISFRRLFLGPMCLTLLVCLSTSGQFRREMGDTLKAEPLMLKILLGFILMQFISIGLSKNIPAAIKNFVNYQFIWTFVFFGSVYCFRKERNAEKFFKLFISAIIIIGFIAIIETMNRGVLWKDHIPSFLQVDLETMAGALESSMRFGMFRAKSVYNQPLPFAEIMGLSTPVVLYFIFAAKKVWHRVAFILVDLILLHVLTLPQSRLGIIAFLLSHALFIFVWSGRIWLRNRLSIAGPMVTLAYPILVIAVAGAIMSIGSLRERVIGGSDTIYSDQSRRVQKRMARSVILRNPLLGHGPKQGPGALGFVGGDGALTLDNYYLWIALDYGMIGFALFYGMILLAIHRTFMIAIRDQGEDNNRALVVMTILVAFILVKTVLSEEDNHSLLFILLGMTVALMWREKQKALAKG